MKRQKTIIEERGVRTQSKAKRKGGHRALQDRWGGETKKGFSGLENSTKKSQGVKRGDNSKN